MKIDSKKGDVIKAFEKLGYKLIGEKEHIKMKNGQGISISLPNHKRMKGSTLSRICRDANIDKGEFFKLV